MAKLTQGPAPIVEGGYASPLGIHDQQKVTHSDQTRPVGHHKVGTRGTLPDGRVFYYASNGAVALSAARLCIQPAVLDAAHNDITFTATGVVGAGASVIPLSETDVDTADAVKDYYAEGYALFTNGTGEGQYRKVRSHQALDNDGSATKNVVLYDPLETATAATTEMGLVANPYQRVLVSTTTALEAIVGATCVNVTASGAIPTDVTAAAANIDTYFFWMQTWGPCAVITGTASLAPGDVMTGGTAAGEVEQRVVNLAATTTNFEITPYIGSVINVGGNADTESILLDLRIRP
jgi:hypothetical protein